MRSNRTTLGWVSLGVLVACALVGHDANAQQTLRKSIGVQGGMRVVGSSMGWDCGAGLADPPGSTVDCTGAQNTDDSSPDIYWVNNTANAVNQPFQSRTSAMLSMPPGATVQYARLYWGGRNLQVLPQQTAQLEFGNDSHTTTEDDHKYIPTGLGTQQYYQSTADVTQFVATHGSGEYAITGVDAIVLANVNQDVAYAAWALVVVYKDTTETFTQVDLYDGFDAIGPAIPTNPITSASSTLNIKVPKSPNPHGQIGFLAYEGDFKGVDSTGDQVTWNNTVMSDALNPADNFFNSSRTLLGVAVKNAMDAPQLQGDPGTMASFNLDVVDCTGFIKGGQNNTIKLTVTSPNDTLFVGAVVTALRGCETGVDCTDVSLPACNLATGNCAECVIGDDSTCTMDIDGTKCVDKGGTDPECGCQTKQDCLDMKQVCNTMTHNCETPCTTDADCKNPQQPKCDTNKGICVQCLTDADCMAGQMCDQASQTCVDQGGTGGAGGAGGGSAAGGAGGGMGTSAGGAPSTSGTGTATNAGGGAPAPDYGGLVVQGGGCSCDLPGAGEGGLALGGAVAALGAALAAARRRRRR